MCQMRFLSIEIRVENVEERKSKGEKDSIQAAEVNQSHTQMQSKKIYLFEHGLEEKTKDR